MSRDAYTSEDIHRVLKETIIRFNQRIQKKPRRSLASSEVKVLCETLYHFDFNQKSLTDHHQMQVYCVDSLNLVVS